MFVMSDMYVLGMNDYHIRKLGLGLNWINNKKGKKAIKQL